MQQRNWVMLSVELRFNVGCHHLRCPIWTSLIFVLFNLSVGGVDIQVAGAASIFDRPEPDVSAFCDNLDPKEQA